MSRPDHNNDPAYLKGYAILMHQMARKYRGTVGALVWARAASNARRRAADLSVPVQGRLL